MPFFDVDKFEIYQTMGWSSLSSPSSHHHHRHHHSQPIDFSLYDIAVASFGGAVALAPRRPRPVTVPNTLRLFSAAGRLLATVPLEVGATANICDMAWSDDEALHVLLDDGAVLRYSLTGAVSTVTASIFDASNTKGGGVGLERVLMAHVWARGCVALSDTLQVYVIEDWRTRPRPTRLHNPNLDPRNLPTAIAVVEAVHNISNRLEVFFALWQHGVEGASVAVVDGRHSELHPLVLGGEMMQMMLDKKEKERRRTRKGSAGGGNDSGSDSSFSEPIASIPGDGVRDNNDHYHHDNDAAATFHHSSPPPLAAPIKLLAVHPGGVLRRSSHRQRDHRRLRCRLLFAGASA